MTKPRLRAVPETAERVLGLIRVSKERDGMVAPEVQEAAIADYSTTRGYDVVEWLEGLDESGSQARSAWWSRLEQAVGMVEAGRVDVIVVWKYSRVARNRLRWAVAVDRVETAGGRIESATEQVDTSTSTGRFTRGMLAELQAFEAERIGEVWSEVHERRVRQGRPSTGKPKWGYTYDPVEKLHVPDPETGPVLADLYARYVAGSSVFELARWLNQRGYRTLADGLWSDRTLRRVLDAGFATGRFRHHGDLVDGVHEALIDDDLWQAYLDARHRRKATPRRTGKRAYLLSGLLRCGECGGRMVAGQFKENGAPVFRCKVAKEQGPQACAQGASVVAHAAEEAVLDWVRDRADDVDVASDAAREVASMRATIEVDRKQLQRQIDRTAEKLTRLAIQNAEDPLPPHVWREAYDTFSSELQRLEAELAELDRSERRAPSDVQAIAAGLLAEWDEHTVVVRREVLGQLIDHVTVQRQPRVRQPNGQFVSSATYKIVPAWKPG